MSVAATSIYLAVLTVLGHDMVSHRMTAIMPISYLMDTSSLAERIGKLGHCTLQWNQPHQ